jgi:L-fucose isomerase-like protein
MSHSFARTVRAAAGLCGLLLLAACATSHQEERINAVKDFIGVAELGEVDSIDVFGRVDDEVLNDEYVIVKTRKQEYLLEYASRCFEDPFTNRVKPDVRRDPRRIYAGSDTYRGCWIKSLYTITPEQAEELRTLGQAPGE